MGPEKALNGSGNSVIIVRRNGDEEHREGGSRSWRNNNPGNIEPGGFASRNGAIGVGGRFAVFSSEAAGTAAQGKLLRAPSYSSLTLDGAIARWAPSHENPTERYQGYVSSRSGVARETPMNTITDGDLLKVMKAMRTFEGWKEGSVTIRRP